MRSDFPLQQKSSDLGIIPEPIVPIEILTKYGFQKFDFLVDTGADCSMMPKSMAKIIGIELKELPIMHFGGIEGKMVVTFIVKITIKITKKPIRITCALSNNDQCPFILGRKDIFNKLNILFDNKRDKIVFTEI